MIGHMIHMIFLFLILKEILLNRLLMKKDMIRVTVSPIGDKIVFTSIRSGDLELYTCNIDGSNVTQITNQLGYDGGAFFSNDGKKLVFRSSRPKN